MDPHAPRHTRHIALTGNIASGKSTVSARLAELGATIIDADQLARDAVAPGTPGLAAVVARFGADILASDGTLDRAALRGRVFNDTAARRDLEAIIHPEVRRLRAVAVAAARARGDVLVVSDSPLVFEAGLVDQFEGVLLVDAPVAVRRQRLLHDRGLAPDVADAMIAAQWPSDQKRARADWVIDNDDTREALRARVDALWPALIAPPLPTAHPATNITR